MLCTKKKLLKVAENLADERNLPLSAKLLRDATIQMDKLGVDKVSIPDDWDVYFAFGQAPQVLDMTLSMPKRIESQKPQAVILQDLVSALRDYSPKLGLDLGEANPEGAVKRVEEALEKARDVEDVVVSNYAIRALEAIRAFEKTTIRRTSVNKEESDLLFKRTRICIHKLSEELLNMIG